jgi:hypothetical protein
MGQREDRAAGRSGQGRQQGDAGSNSRSSGGLARMHDSRGEQDAERKSASEKQQTAPASILFDRYAARSASPGLRVDCGRPRQLLCRAGAYRRC